MNIGQGKHLLHATFLLAFLTACGDPEPTQGEAGNPAVGEVAVRQYACTTCHQIPGVVGPDTWVGPSLRHIGDRIYIAGRLPNTPDNMTAWLVDPQAIAPNSAMPDLGVTSAHARDIAAFLYRMK